jgi:hypothetical protein
VETVNLSLLSPCCCWPPCPLHTVTIYHKPSGWKQQKWVHTSRGQRYKIKAGPRSLWRVSGRKGSLAPSTCWWLLAFLGCGCITPAQLPLHLAFSSHLWSNILLPPSYVNMWAYLGNLGSLPHLRTLHTTIPENPFRDLFYCSCFGTHRFKGLGCGCLLEHHFSAHHNHYIILPFKDTNKRNSSSQLGCKNKK